MGYTALNILLFMLSMFVGVNSAFAQTPGSLFSNKNNYQAFSNQYNYQEDLLADVPQGRIGTVWRARMYGSDTRLESQTAELGGVDFYIESKYKLVDTLEALVFIRAKFESGRSQDFYGDIEPSTGFLLREAAIQWRPIDLFRFKAGVINQDWLNMPLLLSRQSFPGASGRLSYKWNDRFESSLTSQVLIPTSKTLATRTVDREATPQLVTHTLGTAYKGEKLSVIADASVFDFKNLPSFVAFQSRRYGNTIEVLTGPNNSAFKYDFKGWFANVSAEYRLTETFEPNISLSRLHNQNAPDTFNDGQILAAGTKVHMENHILYLGYENFFNESDAAPAFYASPGYGNTNKEGYGLDTWLQFKKLNFRIRAQYYRATLINRESAIGQSGVQQDQDYFYLAVETGYDRI